MRGENRNQGDVSEVTQQDSHTWHNFLAVVAPIGCRPGYTDQKIISRAVRYLESKQALQASFFKIH